MTLEQYISSLENYTSSTRKEITKDLIRMYSLKFANYILSLNGRPNIDFEFLWEEFLKEKDT